MARQLSLFDENPAAHEWDALPVENRIDLVRLSTRIASRALQQQQEVRTDGDSGYDKDTTPSS